MIGADLTAAPLAECFDGSVTHGSLMRQRVNHSHEKSAANRAVEREQAYVPFRTSIPTHPRAADGRLKGRPCPI
jgi:hypothetical protein